MKAIFKRELRAYFTSPIGYIFIGVFAFISGFYFDSYLLKAGYGDIDSPFRSSLLILVLLVPVLTMRLIAEERSSKTEQLLLSSPVSVWSIVLGKIFAAMCVYAGAMVTSFPYVVIITVHGRPVWGKIFAAYLGFLLLGLCFISIGIFFSSITESQIIALVVTLGVMLVMFLINILPSTGTAALDSVVGIISIIKRFYDFLNGILKVENIIYYLSISALFAFFTVRGIEKRRWS